MKKLGLMTVMTVMTLGGASVVVNAEGAEGLNTTSNATLSVKDGDRELTQAPSFHGGEQIIDGQSNDTVVMEAKGTLVLKNFMNANEGWKLSVSMNDFISTAKSASTSFSGELKVKAKKNPTEENYPAISEITVTNAAKDIISDNTKLGQFSYTFENAELTLKDKTIDDLATGAYSAQLNWTMSPAGTYTHAAAATPKTK